MLKSWTETHLPEKVHTESTRAKLNVFQRLVRQWENIHPYNGAQALKIRGNIDAKLCQRAWYDALNFLGLGVVSIRENSYSHRCLNGEASLHGVVFCPPETSLNDWLGNELNHSFDSAGGVPFRPFVIQEDGYFWMGVCYQHWVADSASIRMLMHEWFVRQFDPGAASGRPIRFHAGGYLSLFGPHRSDCPPAEVFLSSLRWHSQFRKARRIEDRAKFQEMSAQFIALPTLEGMIEPLRAAANRLGVTVNDLFLASIAMVCQECVPTQKRLRRRELAIGSIVDLRPKSRQSLSDVFDLLLGFTSIRCASEELEQCDTLVQSIAHQTREQKRGGLPLASCLRMFAGLVAGKRMSRERMIEFYRKRVPLAGASSNVNLNRCWPEKYAMDPILDYLRVAPTGPMTPLVFATTTLGNDLSIGLTYRCAIISPEQAAIIGQKFVEQLIKFG